MKKVIVTTTINKPTKAIGLFESMSDWELVVIGDKKTPSDYKLGRGQYISPDEQEKYDKPLSDAIGWNCIQRRNFGLLWAHDMGADIIAVVDDDNIPYENWGDNLLVGKESKIKTYDPEINVFDPIGATNYQHLWHRGFPIQYLQKRSYKKTFEKVINPDIQADFWNGDPDIDAICRMEHSPECNFDPSCFPFATTKIAPFNSQNTFLSKKCLKDYFLFPHIGRMDDIWAAYYVQAKGYKVIFNDASVYQERNPHDLTKDMKKEYLGYENNINLIDELIQDSESIYSYLPGKSIRAFELYKRHFK